MLEVLRIFILNDRKIIWVCPHYVPGHTERVTIDNHKLWRFPHPDPILYYIPNPKDRAMLLHMRNMQHSDIDAVYAIESVVHKAPWTKEILKDCVLVGYDCRVLALIQGEKETIIGYVICRYAHKTCHLLNLCINETKQKRGYGRIMLNTLLRSLAKPGINFVVLEVRPSNKAALSLYKKLGFEQTEIKKDYYSDSLGLEDAIVLQKIILGPSSRA